MSTSRLPALAFLLVLPALAQEHEHASAAAEKLGTVHTNILSAAAARRDRAVGEELHASDYQMYAYLQTAQDTAAKRLLDAAIPARWALERRAWAEAASLQPHQSRYPYTEAMTHFARALGAAHTGELAAAGSAIATLEQLRDRLSEMHEAYWAEQVEIERISADAWLALAFRTLYGAMRAAQLAGTLDVARRYSRQLLDVCVRADAPRRRELADAERLITAAAQAKPDLSGHWVLASSVGALSEIAGELTVRESTDRGSTVLTVDRTFQDHVRSDTYQLGVEAGVVTAGPGSVGSEFRYFVTWDGATLVMRMWSRNYSGPTRAAGPYSEREERWSIDEDRILHVSITERRSDNEPSTTNLTYRRQ